MVERARSHLSAVRRARDLGALAGGEVVDVLVVGGGVTGAAVALDAVTRGLTVALLERRDLANGTSRWSSKLVHGGLRYLASGDVGLALESARERRILMERTAPHLVRALPFVMPLTASTSRGDLLRGRVGQVAGDTLRAAAGTRRATLPRPRRLRAAETVSLAPVVRRSGLEGALLFWDGQLVDDARLVLGIARTAAAHGARILTYAEVGGVDATGALATDIHGGGTFEVRARHVVNATGVWADRLAPQVALRPSKGAHLVVRGGPLADLRVALMVPLPGASNRYVVALPQLDGDTFVGLTDDPAEGPLLDEPAVTAGEEEQLLATLNRVLAVPVEPHHVVGRFAGYRPLLVGAVTTSTADLSRRHLVSEHEGVLTVTGGKLTTARRMAADVVDRIAMRPDVRTGPCRTASLPLVGAAPPAELDRVRAPARLVRRYGTEAPAVAALAEDDPTLLDPIAPGLPVLGVELRFGVLAEGALTTADLLARRTRLALVPADAEVARPAAEAALTSTAKL